MQEAYHLRTREGMVIKAPSREAYAALYAELEERGYLQYSTPSELRTQLFQEIDPVLQSMVDRLGCTVDRD